MAIKIEFDQGNAAFEGELLYLETARILRGIADEIERKYVEGYVRDINGNRIGQWSMDDPEE